MEGDFSVSIKILPIEIYPEAIVIQANKSKYTKMLFIMFFEIIEIYLIYYWWNNRHLYSVQKYVIVWMAR